MLLQNLILSFKVLGLYCAFKTPAHIEEDAKVPASDSTQCLDALLDSGRAVPSNLHASWLY